MSKLVSDLDYQDVLGTTPREHERVEYISNVLPIIINSGICPTEKTKFEIKICFDKEPVFGMGSCDFTKGRKIARLSSMHNGRGLVYDYPNDLERRKVFVLWSHARPDTAHKDFPHVIEFGNYFIHDLTSNRESRSSSKLFSTKAPFGLFGIIEYKGEGLPWGYVIPQSDIYKIYYFKAYEEDKLIADMIPVKDLADTLCMFDVIRNQYFYPVDESGKEVKLTEHKEKKCGNITSFFRKKLKSLQYSLKGEWNPKYIGGKLEVIQHGNKKKVVAYSTSDNDKIVVWNKSDVVSASWDGSTIMLSCGICGFHKRYLYAPNKEIIK